MPQPQTTKNSVPKNLVKVSKKGSVHRVAPDTSLSIKKTAQADGATDIGKWDKIIMMTDDMKCFKFNNADALINTRTNTYVIGGQAKNCGFAEVIPELFGDQLGTGMEGKGNSNKKSNKDNKGNTNGNDAEAQKKEGAKKRKRIHKKANKVLTQPESTEKKEGNEGTQEVKKE